MKDLCEQLQEKRKELERLKARGQQDRTSNHAKMLKMRSNLTRVAEGFKVSNRPLHVYISALDKVQQPSPPSYVLQKQALACREMHRQGSQSKSLDRMEQECSGMIRRVGITIQDLREECASMELFLLKQMVVLDDELSHIQQNNSSILKQQDEKLKDLGKKLTPTTEKKFNLMQQVEEAKRDILTIEDRPQSVSTRSNSFTASFELFSSLFSPKKNATTIKYQCDSITSLHGEGLFPQKTVHMTPVA